MMPLPLAAVGEEMMVQRIGGAPNVRTHLENLGFVAGASVIVLSEIEGNLIVNVKEARIALNKEMAMKIFVQ
ncbi:MAG: ferrous iron transport protein A [Clostridiales bacterium]|nr:ferrous iron transport protein A [Clostridiales bacterium]